jgi:hypothetical protein
MKSSSGLLQDAPFYVVLENGSHAPLFSPSNPLVLNHLSISMSTNLTSSISTGPLTEDPMTSDQTTIVNPGSLTFCLLRWDSKMIESIGFNARDASCG